MIKVRLCSITDTCWSTPCFILEKYFFFKKRNESNQPEKRYLFWKRSKNVQIYAKWEGMKEWGGGVWRERICHHLEIKQLMSLCLWESTTSDYRSHTCEQKVLLPPSCMSDDLFILDFVSDLKKMSVCSCTCCILTTKVLILLAT